MAKTVLLSIANRTGDDVDVRWVGSDGEWSYLRVAAGDERVQETFPEHRWRILNADGTQLAAVTLGQVDVQVLLRASHAATEGVSLALSNHSSEEVDLRWVGSDGERSYLRVVTGEKRVQATFPGHAWRCYSVDGPLLAAMMLGNVDAEIMFGGLTRVVNDRACAHADFYHHERSIAPRTGSRDTAVTVRAHATVSEAAVDAAAAVVRAMLEGTPEPVLARLAAAGCSVAVAAREQLTSDIPEHSFLSGEATGNWEYDATTRGVGGNPSVPVTSVGEENLLDDEEEPPAAAATPQTAAGDDCASGVIAEVCEEVEGCEEAEDSVEGGEQDAREERGRPGGSHPPQALAPSSPTVEVSPSLTCACVCCGADAPSPAIKLRTRRRRDLYPLESILVHEFAHCVMDVGLDEAARERIRAAHAASIACGLVDREVTCQTGRSSPCLAEGALP